MKSIFLFQNDLRIQNNDLVAEAILQSTELVFGLIKPKDFDQVDEFGFSCWSEIKKKIYLQVVKSLAIEIQNLQFNFIFFDSNQEFKDYCVNQKILFAYKLKSPFLYENEIVNLTQGCIEWIQTTHDLLIQPENLDFIFDSFTSFTKFKKAVEKSKWPVNKNSGKIHIGNLINEKSIKLKPTTKSPIRCLDWVDFENSKNPDTKLAFDLKGDRDFALKHLQNYIWTYKHIQHYKQTRNGMINFYDSSKFSVWLAWGVLSAVEVFSEILKFEDQYGANGSTYWLKLELLWRDYFKWMAFNCGDLLFMPRGLAEEYVEPELNPVNLNLFKSWCEGQTQHSFINANMIELKSTGFMSNRGRQNVASYLTHELKLSWLWGAKWFESQLIDYDPASNYGNWQYVSGVGGWGKHQFDYDWQSQTYDPEKEYQKLWLKYLS